MLLRYCLVMVLGIAMCIHVKGGDLEKVVAMKAKAKHLLRDACCDFSNEECLKYILDEPISNEEVAKEWVRNLDDVSKKMSYISSIAGWNFATNLTEHNKKIRQDIALVTGDISLDLSENQGRRFDTSSFDDVDRRLFKLLLRGGYLEDADKRQELSAISSNMQELYSKATACQQDGTCLPLEPDLQNIMASSRDYDRLLWAWKGWREASGKKIGPMYPGYVKLKNEQAMSNNYPDESFVWQEKYEMPDGNFDKMLNVIYENVKPMYVQLHAYVRRKLGEKYGRERTDIHGAIPAHLLGNMWAQQWQNIYDMVIPYPAIPEMDVTEEMQKQNYTVHRMFKVAERFFTSIGMEAMPDTFWKNSMFEKPTDREVVCHGSASNFIRNKEVRIKMCTEVTTNDLYTVHHEMGHCEYYMQYHDQHMVFSTGANPGFHEAVGDTIALSVVTPDYLRKIGLANEYVNSKESDINFLMKVALNKIAFLPFGLLIDKWRWDVFRGVIKPDSYNEAWWKLRREYQGIAPPIERTEEDFDPGAKYHIPSGTPYIRYFISFVLQFQFHRAMCDASGHTGPLHLCNNYESLEAGEKLKNMLKLGASKPWWEALEQLTGQDFVDPSAIHEYFAPLMAWLKQENGDDVGWQHEL